jgi:hypothetical protein
MFNLNMKNQYFVFIALLIGLFGCKKENERELNIFDSEPESIIWQGFKLYKVDNLTNDFQIKDKNILMNGKKYTGVSYQAKSGVAAVTFFENDAMGVFVKNGKSYNYGKNGKGQFVTIAENQIPILPFLCETSDSDLTDNHQPNTALRTSAACKVARIGFEATNAMFKELGSSQVATANYISGVFNVVKQIYRNENIPLKLSVIYINSTPDSYGCTNATQCLSNLMAVRPVGSFNADLMHLVDIKPNGTSLGGLAFVGVLCGASPYGYSSIYKIYQQLPLYSWSVNVIAHELGHNFGSKHTHWCGWNLPNGTTGRIDSCYQGEGTCGTIRKQNFNATIMSYCYNNGAINLNKGFGPLPGNVMRASLQNASCLPLISQLECDSLKNPPVTPNPVVRSVTVSGVPFINSDTSIRRPASAVDGNINTRFVSQGATTVTFTYNQTVTIKRVELFSGFGTGSPNQTFTISVNGVAFNLNYSPNIAFTRTGITLTGTTFVLVTTGVTNISRIKEIDLKLN